MKILIIAPYFAPSSEVPSVRMVSLSNYLIKQGHHVTVLCYSRKMLLSIYSEQELSTKVPEGVEVIGFDVKNIRIPFISDIVAGIDFKKNLSTYVDILSFDVVFTTCGPYFTLKAMPMIKKKFGVPYVLDFRDLGALNYRPQLRTENTKTSLWKKPIKAWHAHTISRIEYEAVDTSEKLICVSPIDKEKMQEAYSIPDNKIVIATNGYDENKLSTVIAKEHNTDFLIGAVFGKFMYYSKERATSILMAIQKQYDKGNKVKLMHIGRQYEWINEVLKENNINTICYEPCGLKEYSVGMSILGGADFFVVEDTSPDDVGTKIYDYIYWNKPIIAAVPKHIPLAKLVSKFDHGFVCDSKDEIEKAIDEVVQNRYKSLDSSIDIKLYSRSYQNQIMERCMKEASNGGEAFVKI